MKRWVVCIILCLILGAITTVAVAWGCACTIDAWSGGRRLARLYIHSEDATEGWVVTRKDRSGATLLESERTRSEIILGAGVDKGNVAELLPVWASVDLPSAKLRETGWELRTFDARGWPFVSLFSFREDFNYFDSSSELSWGIATGFNPSGIADDAAILPLRPIWPGFVIDTLFYAAIWFGVFFGFTSAKRFIRSKRGRCPRCGYDLRCDLVAGCPECGWQREERAP